MVGFHDDGLRFSYSKCCFGTSSKKNEVRRRGSRPTSTTNSVFLLTRSAVLKSAVEAGAAPRQTSTHQLGRPGGAPEGPRRGPVGPRRGPPGPPPEPPSGTQIVKFLTRAVYFSELALAEIYGSGQKTGKQNLQVFWPEPSISASSSLQKYTVRFVLGCPPPPNLSNSFA